MTQQDNWTFEGFGPEFDTHVAAHLPGYADVQRLVSLVASFALPMGGTFVDLGASTGRTAAEVAALSRHIVYHLYDEDASMLDLARQRLGNEQVNYHLASLPDGMAHTDADMTVALWLLQFIHPTQWRGVLASARRRSKPTGCILVAAKTRHPDPRWDEIAVAALDDYKADQGVQAPERAAKTRALRGVMHQVPPAQIARDLVASGWHSPTVLWRWHVWSILGAWGSPLASEAF